METRAMAARARTEQDNVSGRAFVVAMVIVVVALAVFAWFVRYGR